MPGPSEAAKWRQEKTWQRGGEGGPIQQSSGSGSGGVRGRGPAEFKKDRDGGGWSRGGGNDSSNSFSMGSRGSSRRQQERSARGSREGANEKGGALAAAVFSSTKSPRTGGLNRGVGRHDSGGGSGRRTSGDYRDVTGSEQTVMTHKVDENGKVVEKQRVSGRFNSISDLETAIAKVYDIKKPMTCGQLWYSNPRELQKGWFELEDVKQLVDFYLVQFQPTRSASNQSTHFQAQRCPVSRGTADMEPMSPTSVDKDVSSGNSISSQAKPAPQAATSSPFGKNASVARVEAPRTLPDAGAPTNATAMSSKKSAFTVKAGPVHNPFGKAPETEEVPQIVDSCATDVRGILQLRSWGPLSRSQTNVSANNNAELEIAKLRETMELSPQEPIVSSHLGVKGMWGAQSCVMANGMLRFVRLLSKGATIQIQSKWLKVDGALKKNAGLMLAVENFPVRIRVGENVWVLDLADVEGEKDLRKEQASVIDAERVRIGPYAREGEGEDGGADVDGDDREDAEDGCNDVEDSAVGRFELLAPPSRQPEQKSQQDNAPNSRAGNDRATALAPAPKGRKGSNADRPAMPATSEGIIAEEVSRQESTAKLPNTEKAHAAVKSPTMSTERSRSDSHVNDSDEEMEETVMQE